MTTKTKSKSNKVQKTTESSLEKPAFMQGHAGEGLEYVETNDIELPRLKLIQPLSPEKEADPDLRDGEFYHSILEKSLGKELAIVPIDVRKAYILWAPRHMSLGILATSFDGRYWSPPNGSWEVTLSKDDNKPVTWKTKPTVAESKLAEFGSSNPMDSKSRPAATLIYNVLCLLPDHLDLGPCFVSLQRSGIKVAKKLLAKLKILTTAQQIPVYGCLLKMRSTLMKSDGNSFQGYAFENNGFVKDEKLFKLAQDTYKGFAGKNLKVDLEDETVDETQEDDLPF